MSLQRQLPRNGVSDAAAKTLVPCFNRGLAVRVESGDTLAESLARSKFVLVAPNAGGKDTLVAAVERMSEYREKGASAREWWDETVWGSEYREFDAATPTERTWITKAFEGGCDIRVIVAGIRQTTKICGELVHQLLSAIPNHPPALAKVADVLRSVRGSHHMTSDEKRLIARETLNLMDSLEKDGRTSERMSQQPADCKRIRLEAAKIVVGETAIDICLDDAIRRGRAPYLKDVEDIGRHVDSLSLIRLTPLLEEVLAETPFDKSLSWERGLKFFEELGLKMPELEPSITVAYTTEGQRAERRNAIETTLQQSKKLEGDKMGFPLYMELLRMYEGWRQDVSGHITFVRVRDEGDFGRMRARIAASLRGCVGRLDDSPTAAQVIEMLKFSGDTIGVNMAAAASAGAKISKAGEGKWLVSSDGGKYVNVEYDPASERLTMSSGSKSVALQAKTEYGEVNVYRNGVECLSAIVEELAGLRGGYNRHFASEFNSHCALIEDGLYVFERSFRRVPLAVRGRVSKLYIVETEEDAETGKGKDFVGELRDEYARSMGCPDYSKAGSEDKRALDALSDAVDEACRNQKMDERGRRRAFQAFTGLDNKERLVERVKWLLAAGGGRMITAVAEKTALAISRAQIEDALEKEGPPFERYWELMGRQTPNVAKRRGDIEKMLDGMPDGSKRWALTALALPMSDDSIDPILTASRGQGASGHHATREDVITWLSQLRILHDTISLVDTHTYAECLGIIRAIQGGEMPAFLDIIHDGIDKQGRTPTPAELMMLRDMALFVSETRGRENVMRKALTPYVKIAMHYDTARKMFEGLKPDSPTFVGDLLTLNFRGFMLSSMTHELNELDLDRDTPTFLTKEEIREHREAMQKIESKTAQLSEGEAATLSGYKGMIEEMTWVSDAFFMTATGQALDLAYPEDGRKFEKGSPPECATLAAAFFRRHMPVYDKARYYPLWDIKK